MFGLAHIATGWHCQRTHPRNRRSFLGHGGRQLFTPMDRGNRSVRFTISQTHNLPGKLRSCRLSCARARGWSLNEVGNACELDRTVSPALLYLTNLSRMPAPRHGTFILAGAGAIFGKPAYIRRYISAPKGTSKKARYQLSSRLSIADAVLNGRA